MTYMSSLPSEENGFDYVITPSNVWSPVMTLFLGMVIFFLFAIAQVVGALVAALRYMDFEMLASEIQAAEGNLEGFLYQYDLVWPAALSSALVGSLLIFIFIRVKRARFIEYLHLKGVRWSTWVSWGAIYLLLMVLIQLVSLLSDRFQTPFMEDIIKETNSFPMLFLSVGVIAPVFEELLFRGFLFKGWERSPLGGHGTVWLISVIFAVIHMQYDPAIILLIIPMGAVLGYARMYSGSLLVPIVLHVMNNSFSLLYTWFSLQETSYF